MCGVAQVHWSAWYALFMAMMAVSMVLVCIAIKYGEILKNSDISLVFVFLLLYSSASVTFCFMLSGLCSKASTAAAVGGIVWCVSFGA